MKLTDSNYWETSYKSTTFVDIDSHSIASFLKKYLANVKEMESIEIGSYPGTFQPTIGRMGYLLNGIDFNLKNATDLPNWLKTLDLHVGNFETVDFFDFAKSNTKKYDLVCSFGFLEHFTNYEEVIKGHLDLVKPGGKVIITTPNFRGWMQSIPHWLFDRPNLQKHYLPSMNPEKWASILKNNNFEIQFSGYFGGYSFWVDNLENRSKLKYYLLRFTERSISQFRKVFNIFQFESLAFSAFCGIVATKKIADNTK